jgi:ligand-binding sensor domain-containing protein
MKALFRSFCLLGLAALIILQIVPVALASPDPFEFSISIEGEDKPEVYSGSELLELLGRPEGKLTLGVVDFMRLLGMENLSSEVAFVSGGRMSDMKSLGQYSSDGDILLFSPNLAGQNPIALYDAFGQKWEAISQIVVKPDYNFDIYPEVQGVRNIVPDGLGGAWIAATTGLFYLSPEGKAQRMYEEKLDTQWVYDAALDSGGGLWVTQGFAYSQPGDMEKNKGIIHFSPSGEKLGQFTFESTAGGLPNNFTQAIAVDSDDNVWIGHFPGPNGEALTKYTPSTGRWVSFKYGENGLASPSINTIVSDNEGGIWVCGYPDYSTGPAGQQLPPYSGGYSHINSEGIIQSWSYSEASNPELSSFYMGNFWSRAAALDSKGGTYVVRAAGDALAYFYNPDYGNLPIEQSKGGLVDYISFDKTDVKTYTGRELSAIIDKGTYAELDASTGRPVLGATPEIRALAVDARDGVWLGTAGAGLIYQSSFGETSRHFNSRYFDWPSRNSQFNNIRMIKIEPDGTVYVGSNGGLAVKRFEGIEKISPVPKSFSVSSHKVLVNGSPADIAAYNIDGSNYFKLRDLAFVLRETTGKFDVEWSPAQQSVSLLAGKDYIISGGELSDISGGTPSPSTHKLLTEGLRVYPDAYNIGGNNYFKLRDIAGLIGVLIDWDAETQSVIVSTPE